MLKDHKKIKKIKRCQKLKNSNFTILLTTLVDTSQVVYMNLGEEIVSQEASFETFTPIWSDSNENEKIKCGKNPKYEI